MAYTITLNDKEAADIMGALGRMPVDQVADTYVSVKNQLVLAGYVTPQLAYPVPKAVVPLPVHPMPNPMTPSTMAVPHVPPPAPPHPAAAPAPKKG